MKKLFRAVASVYDPRSNEGMSNPAMEWDAESRTEAACQAEAWSRDGYWSVVYGLESGEALCEFSPKGGVQ